MSYKLYLEVQDLKRVAQTLSPQQISSAITKTISLLTQFSEVSPGAKYRFYFDLYTILNNYLDSKFPRANKGAVSKLLNLADKDEAPLRKQLADLEANYKHYQERHEQIWKAPFIIRASAFLTDSEFNVIDLYKNPQFRNALASANDSDDFKAIFRLKNIGQNLMNDFNVESPTLQGNWPTLSAYKVMRHLCKFKSTHSLSLSPQFRGQVDAAIKILNQFLQFSMKIEFHHAIKAPDKQMVEERLADLASDIKKALLSLRPNDTLAFPVGFRTEDGGHAAGIELSHDGQGHYRLALVETGGFAEVIINQTQFRPDKGSLFTIQPLTLHDLLKTPLLDDFLRPVFYTAKDSKTAPQFMLAPFLRLQKDPRLVIERGKVSLQHSKICTNATANALVELNFDPGLYLCFDRFKISHSLRKLSSLKTRTDQSTSMVLRKLTVTVDDHQTTGNEALELLSHIGQTRQSVRKAEVAANINLKENEIKAKINSKSQTSTTKAAPDSTQKILTDDVLSSILVEERNIASLRAMVK